MQVDAKSGIPKKLFSPGVLQTFFDVDHKLRCTTIILNTPYKMVVAVAHSVLSQLQGELHITAMKARHAFNFVPF